MILQKLATDAGTYLGEKVTQAVITVPAYSQTTHSRQATKDARAAVLRRPRSAAHHQRTDLRRRSPTASTRRATRPFSSGTSAEARSTSRCSKSARASSK